MVLEELSNAAAIAGREHEVRDIIKRELAGKVDEIRSDTIGNIICRKGPLSGGPKVMLCAHMDEVGAMVSGFDSKGLVHFVKVGGIDDRVLLSKKMLIGKNRVPGVTGAKPFHFQSESERDKPIPLDQLYLDIGATSKADAQSKVSLGDQIVFSTRFAEFGNGFMKGKALDDRIGCAVLLEIMKQDWSIPVYGVFAVQEEVGERGSQVAAYAIAPEIGIALEGTLCVDLPAIPEADRVTELGKGPALSIMDRGSIPDRALRQQVEKVARENGVPFQYRRSTKGSTDAMMINVAKEGTPTLGVSTPCRNIHSPVSVACKADFENTVRLMSFFLKSVEGGFRP